MTLENSSIQELIDLNNLLLGDNDTYEDWYEAFKDNDQIYAEIIDSINTIFQSLKYISLNKTVL